MAEFRRYLSPSEFNARHAPFESDVNVASAQVRIEAAKATIAKLTSQVEILSQNVRAGAQGVGDRAGTLGHGLRDRRPGG